MSNTPASYYKPWPGPAATSVGSASVVRGTPGFSDIPPYANAVERSASRHTSPVTLGPTFASSAHPTAFSSQVQSEVHRRLQGRFNAAVHTDQISTLAEKLRAVYHNTMATDELLSALRSDPLTAPHAQARAREIVEELLAVDRDQQLARAAAKEAEIVEKSREMEVVRRDLKNTRLTESSLHEQLRAESSRRESAERLSASLRRELDEKARELSAAVSARATQAKLAAAAEARAGAAERAYSERSSDFKEQHGTLAEVIRKKDEELRALEAMLQDRLSEMDRHVADRERERREWAAREAELKEREASLAARGGDAAAQAQAVARDLDTVVRDLEVERTRSERLERAVAELKRQKKQLQMEVGEVEELLSESERERAEIRSKYMSLGEKMEMLLHEEEAVKEESRGVQALLEGTKSSQQELELALHDSRSTAAAEERQLKADAHELKRRLEDEEHAARKKEKKHKKALEAAREEGVAASRELEKAKARCEELEARLRSYTDHMDKELVGKETRTAEMRTKIAGLEADLEKAEKVAATIRKDMERDFEERMDLEVRKLHMKYERRIHELEAAGLQQHQKLVMSLEDAHVKSMGQDVFDERIQVLLDAKVGRASQNVVPRAEHEEAIASRLAAARKEAEVEARRAEQDARERLAEVRKELEHALATERESAQRRVAELEQVHARRASDLEERLRAETSLLASSTRHELESARSHLADVERSAAVRGEAPKEFCLGLLGERNLFFGGVLKRASPAAQASEARVRELLTQLEEARRAEREGKDLLRGAERDLEAARRGLAESQATERGDRELVATLRRELEEAGKEAVHARRLTADLDRATADAARAKEREHDTQLKMLELEGLLRERDSLVGELHRERDRVHAEHADRARTMELDHTSMQGRLQAVEVEKRAVIESYEQLRDSYDRMAEELVNDQRARAGDFESRLWESERARRDLEKQVQDLTQELLGVQRESANGLSEASMQEAKFVREAEAAHRRAEAAEDDLRRIEAEVAPLREKAHQVEVTRQRLRRAYNDKLHRITSAHAAKVSQLKNAHAVHKASVEMELTKTWNDFQRVLEALKWRATGDVAKATEAGKKQAREAARLEIERAGEVHEAEMARLQREAAADRKAADKAAEALRSEVAGLQTQLEDGRAALDRTVVEKSAAAQALEAARVQATAVERDRAAAEKERDDRGTAAAALEGRLREAGEELLRLEKEVGAAKAALELSQEHLEMLVDAIGVLPPGREAAAALKSGTKASFFSAIQTLREGVLAHVAAKEQEARESTKPELDAARKQFAEAQAQADDYCNQVMDLMKKVADLEREVTARKEELASRREELNTTINSERSSRTRDVEKSRVEGVRLAEIARSEAVQPLKAELKGLKDAVLELQRQYDLEISEVRDLAARQLELAKKSHVEQQQALAAGYEERAGALQEHLREEVDRADELQAALSRAEKACRELEGRLKAASAELATAKKKGGALMEAEHERAEEVKKLRAEIREKDSDLVYLRSQVGEGDTPAPTPSSMGASSSAAGTPGGGGRASMSFRNANLDALLAKAKATSFRAESNGD